MPELADAIREQYGDRFNGWELTDNGIIAGDDFIERVRNGEVSFLELVAEDYIQSIPAQVDEDDFEDELEVESKIGKVTAEIGPITFKDEFSDPNVSVTHERETANHKIVSGHSAYQDRNSEYVVQAMGRRPTQLTIEGWLTEPQIRVADDLVSTDAVNIITARWTGTGVITSVDVPYSRTFHNRYGWIFNTTIDCIGVNDSISESLEEDDPTGRDLVPGTTGL